MKKKNTFILTFLLIVLLLYLPLSGKGQLSNKRFRAFVKQGLTDWLVPGAAIGIIHNGRVILAEGFGYRDVEKKLPVTPGTIFAIGSTSKAFTTLAMGILVDEGKLEWDRPVKTYLPDFKLYDPYVTGHITPRDLVIHNSGLPRHDMMWYGSKRTRKELYNALQYLEPGKGFRSAFQYQNLMYMTAGYLVGRITGSSWEEVVRKRILHPLGMTGTNFCVKVSQKSGDFALPYGEEDGKIKKIPFYSDLANIGPAGSINANVNDMLRWLKLHLHKGKWGDKQVINKATLDQLHTPQVIAGGLLAAFFKSFKEFSCLTYGMGWFIQHYRGHTFIHHGGNIDGFSAMVGFMPGTKSGIVVLANKNGTFFTYAAAFHVFDRLLGAAPASWSRRMKTFLNQARGNRQEKQKAADKFRKKNTSPTHPLKEYAGEFEHPGYGSLFISCTDNILHLEYNKFSSPLKHYHYNTFKIETGLGKGMKFQFHIDEKGYIHRVSAPLDTSVDKIIFERAPEKKMKTAAFLQKFVGRYNFNGVIAKVFLKGGKTLVLEVPGQPLYELVPYKKTTFDLKGMKGFSVEFVLDKEGNVILLISHQPNGDFTAKREYESSSQK